MLITQDEAWRRGATGAAEGDGGRGARRGAGVRRVVVLRRTGGDVPMQEGRDVWWHDVATDETECPCEPMDSEDLLYLLYTSGTTAKPKGIVHTTAGYLVGAATTHHYIFDVKPETDVFWCAADVGWVTGHSYIVYGPLCNVTTGVMYEGVPDYPDKDRWWDDRRALRRDDPLHGADRDPRAHEVGGGVRGQARSLVAAAARHGRRADQPGGVDLVPRAHRRRPGRRSSTRGGRPRPGWRCSRRCPG